MSYMNGDWDENMDADANLLRGLQNRSDPNNEPSPANGTVAILIVLLALFCFLWYDEKLLVSSVFLSSFNVLDDDSHKRYTCSLLSPY
jgi:hypothetical protein